MNCGKLEMSQIDSACAAAGPIAGLRVHLGAGGIEGVGGQKSLAA
jgi:hypothetical protein